MPSPSLLVMWNSNFINAKILHGNLLRPWLCNRLALKTMLTNFLGQRCREAQVPFIFPIIVCYSSLAMLVIQIFDLKNYSNFLWTSIKTFAVNRIECHDHADPFSWLNDHQSVHTPGLPIFVCYNSPSLLVT